MMRVSGVKTVAIIGAGLIGQGWAIRFAMAGLTVRVYDKNPRTMTQFHARLAEALSDMAGEGLCDDPHAVSAKITLTTGIESAVSEADYVQESVPERVDVKWSVCAEIDRCLSARALVGSSSSGIAASDFTADLKNRARFYVVHPVNPPHLVPVVEIVPAPWSETANIPVLRGLMERLGQSAVVVNREIEGFILNRLQGALLNEAWALYEEGYASAADIDRTVRDGLGRRWAFMGPFETISLNAPDGIRDYASRLSSLYHNIALSRRAPKAWSLSTAERLARELADGAKSPNRAQALARRNRKLMQISKLHERWKKDGS